jgi:hypothetical protein
VLHSVPAQRAGSTAGLHFLRGFVLCYSTRALAKRYTREITDLNTKRLANLIARPERLLHARRER